MWSRRKIEAFRSKLDAMSPQERFRFSRAGHDDETMRHYLLNCLPLAEHLEAEQRFQETGDTAPPERPRDSNRRPKVTLDNLVRWIVAAQWRQRAANENGAATPARRMRYVRRPISLERVRQLRQLSAHFEEAQILLQMAKGLAIGLKMGQPVNDNPDPTSGPAA